eukprot:gi/632955036/ref/XP_007893273.1/ PREDICTED: NIPA-like protein 2 [Callorhinchus milii]
MASHNSWSSASFNHSDLSYQQIHQTQVIGTILAITGNILISISLTIQKQSHILLSGREDSIPFYKSKLWWCGIVVMGIGEIGNFVAYGFAPASLVAPLGCISIIASSVLSVMFLREMFRASDAIGTAVALLGTYLLITFAPDIHKDITANDIRRFIVNWEFLIYLLVETVLFCALLYLYERKGLKHIVIPLLISSLLASLTVISVKAVNGMLANSIKGNFQLQHPIFYVMLILLLASCISQAQYLNEAIQLYGSMNVVPMNFVFSTVSAILAGIIFYQEFHSSAFLNVIMVLFGSLLSFLGVFLITRNREKKTSEVSYVDPGTIPKLKSTAKIQPDFRSKHSYGTVPSEKQANDCQTANAK